MGNISLSIDTEPDLYSLNYKSIIEGIPPLIDILNKYNIKATFFITGDVLERYPNQFKKLMREGHEIALHGYRHKRFDILSNVKKQEDIKKSINLYKKIFKKNPTGFRAPQHSIDDETLKILKINNIQYDSSLTPWNFYHIIFFWKIKQRFFNNFKKMKINKTNGIYEIPASSFFFPFSSITIRVLPKSLLKIYLYLISKYKNSIFLMHSWDLIDIPKSKLSKFFPSKRFINNLDYSLNYLSKKNQFITINKLIPPIKT